MKTKKQSKASTPESKPIGTEILVNVILDRSGSMLSNRAETITGYNEYINGLKKDEQTKYNITLTQFDKPDSIPELTVSYVDTPVSAVPALDESSYVPRGWTPLYDAIGETIRRLDGKTNGRPVLSVIITDGHENASIEFSKERIKQLIKEKESEGWTFVFLGANIDSYTVASSVGISHKNVANYDKQNTLLAFSAMGQNTASYASTRRSSGVSGQSVGESFFADSDRESLMAKSQAANALQTGNAPTFIVNSPAQAGAGETFPRKWRTSK